MPLGERAMAAEEASCFGFCTFRTARWANTHSSDVTWFC
jgi:hypothetical protein